MRRILDSLREELMPSSSDPQRERVSVRSYSQMIDDVLTRLRRSNVEALTRTVERWEGKRDLTDEVLSKARTKKKVLNPEKAMSDL